jgi:phage shock protein A
MEQCKNSLEASEALLEHIEASWRSALSCVADGDPFAALTEMDHADEVFATLQQRPDALASLPSPALQSLKSRIQQLQQLHATLVERCEEAVRDLGLTLKNCQQGKTMLKAYRPAAQTGPHLDKVL